MTYSVLSSGREFRALFISTVECVHEGFKSANPTKSFCNPYVFNTALTRAQSLVVAVGNPFLLLKVESTMSKPKGCWKEYIKRCIEHETLIIPGGVTSSNDIHETLKQLVEQKSTKGKTLHPCLSVCMSVCLYVWIGLHFTKRWMFVYI